MLGVIFPGCEQLTLEAIMESFLKIIFSPSSICCPLTFYREYYDNQGAVDNNSRSLFDARALRHVLARGCVAQEKWRRVTSVESGQ
jgi:hypothetical protein